MASRHRGFVRKRTTWLFLIFALMYGAIAGRLVHVQVVQNEQYREWAKRIRTRNIPIPAPRGGIFDRAGQPLAVNIETASLFAHPKQVWDVPGTAVQVAALLGTQTADIRARLSVDRSFVWLGRQVDARIGDRVWDMRSKLPGVGRQKDTKRVYPSGMLAAQILGFTDVDNKGAEGIEHVQDAVLKGSDGEFQAELDGERRVIPETRRLIRPPENGKNVYLTIDTTIQHIAERALARMAETYRPASACAVVMDPRTGEILALANYPTYDPNRARSVGHSLWRNRAVSDLYEPGSTLKIVTVAAALEEGVGGRQVVARCTGSECIVGKGRIRCSLHHPYMSGHGAVDMYKIIECSCNIGAAHLARRLGARKLYDYEKAFGLLDKANAGFGGEAVGSMIPAEDWRPMRLANIGFGQGIAVTPLQMACVYSTIANGGVYVEPRIIREIRNEDGSVVSPFEPRSVRRVVSKRAALMAAKMLVGCVENGTGKTARIDGRTVAGKTGSAQMAKPKGGYESGVFVASFMGFAPAGRPRLVIAVVVNKPKGSHWGATVAAPVFREIGEKALWYLRVPSDAPTDKEIKQKQQNGDRKRLV